jgi:predicted transcriptional regulator
LEQTKNTQKTTIDSQTDEIEKLRAEKDKIANQVSHYEKLSMMHSEKQKTLENLKSMVRDLQATRDVMNSSHHDYESFFISLFDC